MEKSLKIGDPILYMDEDNNIVKSEVTESNLNWISKNLGVRAFQPEKK